MGAEQSSTKPNVCLVPPLIRRRRVRPICANEVCFGLDEIQNRSLDTFSRVHMLESALPLIKCLNFLVSLISLI